MLSRWMANSSESVFNETCQFVRVLPIWQVWLTVAYRQLFRGKGMFVEQRRTIALRWGGAATHPRGVSEPQRVSDCRPGVTEPLIS